MAYPSKYTRELAEEICELIATTPRGVAYVLATGGPRFPHQTTFSRWLRESEELQRMLTAARARQADLLFDQCLEIADDTTNDTLTIGEGKSEKEVCNSEWVNRSRLRIDTRLKMASRLNPKLYGDKIDVNQRIGSLTQDEALKEL